MIASVTEKIKKQVLSNMADSSMKDTAALTITDDFNRQSRESTPRPQTPTSLMFVVDMSVLSTATANKKLLPAPIMTNFPHI
jgi:hypothetical protein